MIRKVKQFLETNRELIERAQSSLDLENDSDYKQIREMLINFALAERIPIGIANASIDDNLDTAPTHFNKQIKQKSAKNISDFDFLASLCEAAKQYDEDRIAEASSEIAQLFVRRKFPLWVDCDRIRFIKTLQKALREVMKETFIKTEDILSTIPEPAIAKLKVAIDSMKL